MRHSFLHIVFLTSSSPGLPEFLQTMANKYEMHVYMMGTRAYAEEVCAAIDPGGKIFGNRILSRDESGSEYRSIFPGITSVVLCDAVSDTRRACVVPSRIGQHRADRVDGRRSLVKFGHSYV